MAYKFKQYGDGFKILGKYEGWHYGILTDCMPKSFVFLKPINDNDYVFACADSTRARYIDRFCGKIELSWNKCINGEFIEISAEEAQKLLDEKSSVYASIPRPQIGDTILVQLPISDEWEEMKVVDYCNSEYGYQLKIMITDTISTIQQFVKNGGRYEKDREPVYGEPFYGTYMEQFIEKNYEFGDKIQVEMENGKVYSGLLLEVSWRYMKLVSGRKIWKNKQNLKDISLERVKTITLIERRKPEFDMDKVDPEYWCHKRENTDTSDYSKVDTNDIERRNKNKEAFERLYPDVAFDDSHVICVEGGCSLFFPFINNGVNAEVYLVQKNGMNAKKIECKVGRPYPNKCSYHVYNSKDKEYCETDLYTYLSDANAEYHDVYIVCVWTVDITVDDKNKDIKFIQMYKIGTIKPQTDKKNTHFVTMRIEPLLGNGENLFAKKHKYVMEQIMDRECIFLLNNDDDSIIPLKGHDEDAYGFLAIQALSHFNARDLLQNLTTNDFDKSLIEVTVDYEDVSPGYFSGSYRKGQKRYEFKILKS